MALNSDFLMKMPLSQKVIILAAVIFLIVLGYWFFVDNKMVTELKYLRTGGDPSNSSRENVASLEAQLEKLKWVERDKQNLEQQIAEKKQQLKEIESRLPSESEMERLLLDLSERAKAAGLTLKDIKPEAVKNAPGGLYKEVPISLKFDGAYKYVMTFFSKVAEMPRIINFSDISITAGSASKGGANSKNTSIEIQVSCKATTYQLQE